MEVGQHLIYLTYDMYRTYFPLLALAGFYKSHAKARQPYAIYESGMEHESTSRRIELLLPDAQSCDSEAGLRPQVIS
jgi:hypothetical protein